MQYYITIYENVRTYVCMHACMHACMHGWMNGLMDGWTYMSILHKYIIYMSPQPFSVLDSQRKGSGRWLKLIAHKLFNCQLSAPFTQQQHLHQFSARLIGLCKFTLGSLLRYMRMSNFVVRPRVPLPLEFFPWKMGPQNFKTIGLQRWL